jgi:hypothetical protein
MSRGEREQYFEEMEKVISFLNENDQKKMEFARNFINELQVYNAKNGARFNLEPTEDVRALEFLVFSILQEYESEVMKDESNYA